MPSVLSVILMYILAVKVQLEEVTGSQASLLVKCSRYNFRSSLILTDLPAPFAMVKLGPDVQSGKTDAYSGYLASGSIWGFSMMHESGTGGAPKYGVVSQMPVLGN